MLQKTANLVQPIQRMAGWLTSALTVSYDDRTPLAENEETFVLAVNRVKNWQA
jgi:hypothetical protein